MPTFAFTVDTNNIASGIPLEFVQLNRHRHGDGRHRPSAGSAAPAHPFMKYIVGGTNGVYSIAEHATNSHAINPDAASAKGALTIAASNWATPQNPEAFSSRGPAVTRRFDTAGAPSGQLRRPAQARPRRRGRRRDERLHLPDVLRDERGHTERRRDRGPGPGGEAVADRRPGRRDHDEPGGALDCTPTAGQPDLDCGAGFVLANKAVAAAQDTSPPVIGAVTSPSSPNGKDGWFTSDVTVGWSVTDVSPILGSSGCGAVPVTSDGSQTLTCQATSIGGSGSRTVTVKLDKSKPVKLKFKGIKKVYANGALPVKSKVKCKAKDLDLGHQELQDQGTEAHQGHAQAEGNGHQQGGPEDEGDVQVHDPVAPLRRGPRSVTLRPC